MIYPEDHIAILYSQATWCKGIAYGIAKKSLPIPHECLIHALAAARDGAQKALNEIYTLRHHRHQPF